MKKAIKNTKKLKLIYKIIAAIILIAFVIWFLFFREIYDENNLPTRFVSHDYVSSRTEAKLYYPGSREYHTFGHSNSAKWGYAAAGAILQSKDSPEQIYSWYRQWLTSHGWHYDEFAFAGLATTQKSLQGYLRGDREKFYIAMSNIKDLGATLGANVPDNVTIFEIRYFINPKPTPTPE